MKFKQLKQEDFDLIRKEYKQRESKKEAQEVLSDFFNVSERTVRKWAEKIGVGVMAKNTINASKILIYDIETSRAEFKLFWTGKQYVPVHAMTKEPRIISISWNWLGEDKVHDLTWDKHQSDKEMLTIFLKEYNKADMVLGQNNDRFDNRWINARAAKFDLDVNTMVRSFDIMKEAKQKFRIPSYSMKFMCKYFGVEQKLEHEGMKMWDMIESGTPEEQKEYLDKMVTYNRGDIISTSALYYRLRKYFGHKSHIGVKNGEEKWTCPDTGSYNVSLYKTTVTPAGTVQRIMQSQETGLKYRITNKQYMTYLDDKMRNSIAQNTK